MANRHSAIDLAAALASPIADRWLLETTPSMRQEIVEVSRHHGISGLIAQNHPRLWPELVSDRKRIAQQSLRLIGALHAVVTTLEEHGITALVYKGPAAAAMIFESLSVRPFGDIDLIVPRHQFHEAHSAIAGLGYRPEKVFSSEERRQNLLEGCEFNFDHPTSGIHLELHWDILPRFLAFDFPVELAIERMWLIQLGNHRFHALSLEDLFVALVAHGTKHGWSSLRWVADIAWAVWRGNLDWDSVLRRAMDTHSVRMLLVAVALAEELFKVPQPPAIARASRTDRTVAVLVGKIRDLLTEPTRTADLTVYKFWVQVRERRQDRIRVVSRLLTDSTVEFRRKTRLPPKADWFARPLRITYIAAKFATRTLTKRDRTGGN